MAESPEDLAGSLQRFGLARDRMRAALAKRTGVGGADLDALEYLEAEGPLTQRDLGDRLCLTSGAITMLVDRLEQAGWVNRRPPPPAIPPTPCPNSPQKQPMLHQPNSSATTKQSTAWSRPFPTEAG